MPSIAELKLFISGKDDTNAAFKSVEGSADGLMTKLGQVGTVMGGFLAANVVAGGAGKIVNFFSGATQAASDLQQSVGGVQSVFGPAAADILKFGQSAANSAGLSANAFNQLATPLGAMLKNAGFGMSEVSAKTIDLTQRAADMAATFGGPVDEAVSAITAAMRGESDPIEKYGVSLKAADIEARALADSGKKAAKELTSQELAAARLALIFDQTSSAAGQFGRESDTAAGKAERLKARQENLAAQMGQYLLPITVAMTEAKAKFVEILATKVVPMVADRVIPAIQSLGRELAPVATFVTEQLVPAFQNLYEQDIAPKLAAAAEVFRQIAGAVGDLASAVADRLEGPLTRVVEFLTGNKEILGGVAVAIGVGLALAFGALAVSAGAAAIGVIAATAPLLAIGVAIAAVAAGVIWLIKNWDDLTARYPKLAAASDAVKAGFEQFTNWITGTFVPKAMAIYDGVKDAVDKAVKYVTDHWDDIQAVIEPQLKALGVIIDTAWNQFKTTIETVLGLIKGVVDVFMGVFTGDWDRAWGGVKQIIETAWNGMKSTIENVIGLIKGLAPLIKDAGEALGSALLDGLKKALSATAGFAGDVAGAVLKAVKEVINSQVIDRINSALQFSFDTKLPGIGVVHIDPVDIPHLAAGGPVVGGRPYIVGERGQELFVPNESGRIVPNHELGAVGGPAVHFNAPVTIVATDREEAIRSTRDVSFALRAMGA